MSAKECSGAFRLLDGRICDELIRLDMTVPTDIQEKAIPVILEGRDVILIAPTGSGKTEAALLPIFHKMLQEREAAAGPAPRLMYVTPLRALNRDIFYRMEVVSRSIGLRSIVRHGDSSPIERRAFLSEDIDWFITTPESFVMMLSHNKTRERLRGLRYVVVDEIHELIDSERGSELEVSLGRLRKLAGPYQFIGISATVSDEDTLRRFYPCRRKCTVVKSEAAKSLEIVVESCGLDGLMDLDKRLECVVSILEGVRRSARSAIVFTNTRSTAEMLGFHLKGLGFSDISVHHGSLSTDVRKKAESYLKTGELWGVIATSSLELGIDIGHLDVTVQYGSPRQVIRLVQRAGRSGHRLGEKSKAIIITESTLDDIVESAVIARRAVAGLLERQEPHLNPLDVLLHQLVGMALSHEVKRPEEAFEALRKTYTFRELDAETFNKVLEFAIQARLIRLSDNTLSPGRRSLSYFFSTNMIPDSSRVPVYEAASNEIIGYLDEDFVLGKLSKDARFILAGREWVVLEIGDERVLVKPAEAEIGLPPSWEGELIPVDYKVAREECSLIYRASRHGLEGVIKDYPYLSKNSIEFISKVINEAARLGYSPPSHNYVLMESDARDTIAVIYPCLGSRANEALAIALGHYIYSRLGQRVAYSSDPIRVYIQTNRPGAMDIVEGALIGLAREERFLEDEMRSAIKSTSVFLWKLSQVARKMGLISKEAGLREASKAVRYLTETIAGEESLRELLTEKLDFKIIREFLSDIALGKKRLVRSNRRGLSPYTVYGGRPYTYGTAGAGRMPEELATKMLEKRVMEKEVILFCLNCGHEEIQTVGNLPEDIVCKKCGAKFIAPIPSGFEGMRAALRRYVRGDKSLKVLDDRDKELVEEAIERGGLVLSHGKNAVIALSVYGIGPRSARRALSAMKFGWDSFLRALYEEQMNWFRVREYIRKE